ncbi:MAG: hypothetical protein WAM14_08045 [Candidatus Nitrosopolaris sp.]
MKFLIKLKELSQNRLQTSIKKQEVWDAIQAGAYNKELVMPMIVQQLMDDGLLTEGNTKDEITLGKIKKSRESIHILEVFNEIINSTHEGRLGVTLNANGLVVSGNLISLKKFYEELSHTLQERSDPESKQGWKLLFDRWIESLPHTEEELELIGIRYVCLEDARFFTGLESIPSSSPGLLWIGKVESVDGFSLGKLGQQVT